MADMESPHASSIIMSACWKGECDKCRGGKLFENGMVGSEKGKSVSWRIWEKDGNGRLVELLEEGCVGQWEEDICEKWDSVGTHVRTKRIQSDLFHILKSNSQGRLLQIYFAMAYTCQYQNEVQGPSGCPEWGTIRKCGKEVNGED